MNTDKKLLFIAITVFVTVFISSLLLLVSSAKAAILGAFLVPCLVLSYRYPRLGLFAFLIYLSFSGTITYAIAGIFSPVGGQVTYTSDYPLFHLAKDAFYFPPLLAIILSSQSFGQLQPKIKPLLVTLAILLGACLLTLVFVNLPQQLAVRHSSPLLMGIIGLKVFIGYIPLILCAYYLIRDQKDLFFLLRLLVILILICCSLCFIQYFLLVSGICLGNSSLPDPASTRATLQARCFVGGSLLYNPGKELIRLPGTFVSPWQWAWLLISSSFVTYAASISDPSRRWRVVSWIAMAAVLAATIISGQRISLITVPVTFLVLLLLTQKRNKWLLIQLGALAVLLIFMISQVSIVQQQVESLIGRWNYSPPDRFILGQFRWLIQNKLEWLGQGLGRATGAARRLGNIELIETFYVKILYEVGLLGFFAFLGVVSTLTILTFKAYRSLQNQSLRRLGICLWVFILFISYNPYYYPLSVDPVAVYYWFFAGILFKLPEIDCH